MLTKDKYNKLLPYVWVCKYKSQMNQPVNLHPRNYRFSITQPDPVPNTDMIWQKPLFSELQDINIIMMKEARRRIYEGY